MTAAPAQSCKHPEPHLTERARIVCSKCGEVLVVKCAGKSPPLDKPSRQTHRTRIDASSVLRCDTCKQSWPLCPNPKCRGGVAFTDVNQMRCAVCGLEFTPPDGWKKQGRPKESDSVIRVEPREDVPSEFWEFLRDVVRVAVKQYDFSTMGYLVTYRQVSQVEKVSVEEWARGKRYLGQWVLWERVYEGWKSYRLGQVTRDFFTPEECISWLSTEFDRQTRDATLQSATPPNAEALASAMRECLEKLRDQTPSVEGTPGPAQNSFVVGAETVRIRFLGTDVTPDLPAKRGMKLFACILSHQGQEFKNALTLKEAVDGSPVVDPAAVPIVDEMTIDDGWVAKEPVVSRELLGIYHDRIRQIDADLEMPGAGELLIDREKLRSEKADILKQLGEQQSVDRFPKTRSTAERNAYDAARKAMADSLAMIRTASPELAAHLYANILKGFAVPLTYDPQPPLNWEARY